MEHMEREQASLAQVADALMHSTDLDDATENVAALLNAGIRPARVSVEIYEPAKAEARRARVQAGSNHNSNDLVSRTARQAFRESGFGQYGEYLRSARWRELRQAALERDGYRCRCCGTDQNLIVHHRCYPNILGTETVDDLTTLCDGSRSCHHAVHKAVGKRRTRLQATTAGSHPPILMQDARANATSY